MSERTPAAVVVTEVAGGDPRLASLIAIHQAYAADHTPAGSGHALAPGTQETLEVRYWLALDPDGTTLGCIGLKKLSAGHGEIKTMHVLEAYRGAGVADALMNGLERSARALGFERMSLETGKGDGFSASRRFYARCGFEPCEAFGPYVDDAFSVCMTKRLQE